MLRDRYTGVLVNLVYIETKQKTFSPPKKLMKTSMMTAPILPIIFGGFILEMIIHQSIKNIYYMLFVVIGFFISFYFSIKEYKQSSNKVQDYNNQRQVIYNRLRYIELINVVFDPDSHKEIDAHAGCIDKLINEIMIDYKS